MAVHTGQTYHSEEVSIGLPDWGLLRDAPKAADVAGSVVHWSTCALEHPDVYYFLIYLEEKPVGQILLHDQNCQTGESLIGYHLFEPQYRGRGIGTKALALLQQFVLKETNVSKLVIITGRDNIASQAIAKKCGFKNVGGAWEDPVNLVVFEWLAPRSE